MDGWAEMVTLSYTCLCGYEQTKTFFDLKLDESVTIRHFCSPKSTIHRP